MPDYIPGTDSGKRTWGLNLKTKLIATPTAYGVTAPLATTFGGLYDTFAADLAIVENPTTRTTPNIVAKNNSRDAMVANARVLAAIIQATPTVTDEQKAELLLTVRDHEASPINPPTETPVAEIVSINGRIVTVRVHALGTETRGKPEGCASAFVYSYVGSAPPADIGAWKFEGASTRTSFEIEFAPTVAAGAQFWLTSQWANPRNQPGPASQPITDYLGGGVAAAA